MIKVAAPNMALQVIDWAIQAHGGGGVSDDFGLAAAYAQRAHAAPRRRPRRGAPQPDRQARAAQAQRRGSQTIDRACAGECRLVAGRALPRSLRQMR